MKYFQVRLRVESKPRYESEATDRDWREDSVTFSIPAKDETEAVAEVGKAIGKLLATKFLTGERVYETL